MAGSGIGGFFGHVFISDQVAESIGWPTGNPFQLEVGVANLAVGILGIVAMGRRDGFREATVIAATVFGVGATVVHVMDVIESGNLAPGNTIQNVSNLLRPALLIAFLAASRRAERSPDSGAQTAGFDQWCEPRIRAAGMMTGSVAAGFGAGFARSAPHRHAGRDPDWRRPSRLRRDRPAETPVRTSSPGRVRHPACSLPAGGLRGSAQRLRETRDRPQSAPS